MLNRLLFPETKLLIEAIGTENIRFVGGCVRDLIVDQPVNDIDFATLLTPEQVTIACNNADLKVIPTGLKHGTVTVSIRGYDFQVTTLRSDITTDGRHAEVAFVDDWEADAARRDFTFNAFYLSAAGKLTDFFGGMDHLKSGNVVFIGDAEQRIKEDYLRILRYFRFLGRFGQGHEVDAHYMRLFSRHAAQVNYLSGERIQTEMFKILCLDNAAHTLTQMQDCGVLHFIFPGDVHFETLEELQKIEEKPNPIRRLASIEGYDVKQLIPHWKLSNEQGKALKLLKTELDTIDPKVILRNLGKDRFKDIAHLEAAKGNLTVPLEEALDFANTWKIPKFPIYGGDVMALGVKEGKKIGQMLTKLENYWEQRGYLLNRDELLKRLNAMAREDADV